MIKHILQFTATLLAITCVIGSVFLIAGRLNMATATLTAAITGPFSGLLWTDNVKDGLILCAIGCVSIAAIVGLGGALFKDPTPRLGIAILSGIVWFCFGAYGILMLA